MNINENESSENLEAGSQSLKDLYGKPDSDGLEVGIQKVHAIYNDIKNEVAKVIVGQEKAMDGVIIAILSGGHVLLEGVPGIAKTLMAKLITKAIDAEFSRIQFTPDLMPADILGASIYNMKTSEFKFVKGPIFANLILIDEINRSPAKTQSALFETMEERQVTIEGNQYDLTEPFIIIATQNPIEQEGTYRLPEAQLDRFQLKINLDFPNYDEEVLILRRFKNDFYLDAVNKVNAVVNGAEIQDAKKIVENVFIKDELISYIAKIVAETRLNNSIFLGASPRASLAILKASKANAAINGRDFVIPDDVRMVTEAVLNHRIILRPEKEMEGLQPSDIIQDIIAETEVPL